MPNRLPSLNALRAFEAAARHLSFKRAADELSVTPTAISHQIRTLEDDLGVALFRRLTRALALTPEGEAMLPKLREAMACIAASVEAVRGMRRDERLTVVAPPSFASRWLVPRLHKFAALQPHVRLHVASSMSAIDGAGHAGEVSTARGDGPEIWVRFGSGRYPGRRVDRLFEPEYVVVCSPSLLRGATGLARPDDLRSHTLIHDDTVPDARERPSWGEWLRAAHVADVDAGAGLHFSDSGLAIAAALDGLGVALLSQPLVAAEIAAGRLAVPFERTLRRRFAYFTVADEGTAVERPVAAFRDWLVDEVRHDPQLRAGGAAD